MLFAFMEVVKGDSRAGLFGAVILVMAVAALRFFATGSL